MRIRSPVLVGRRRELSLLVEWLAEASAGRPRLVVIGGEAGIGKTRLVNEFARIAAEQGAQVLFGAAADYGTGGLPFGAIAEAFRTAGFAEIVQAGLPSGATAQEDQPGSGASDLHPQLRLFESLLALVERLAADRPLVLALDDMHWADNSTREFLAFLARNLGSARLLVLATYRSDDVGRDHPLRRYLTELGRGERVERLAIERLGRDEVREQLRAISGDEPAEQLVDRLFARGQGNPFFSEELLASAGADEPDVVPATLREMLLARVEKLADDARDVLAALAVLGVGDEPLLAQVADVPESAVIGALRAALDGQIVEPAGGAGYGFRHALVREAVYGDLLASQRARLHLRIAQALTGDGVTPTAQLLARVAYHWQRAGRPREAFIASWRAAEATERAHAYPEAALHYESVLLLWDEVDDAAQLLRTELAGTAAEAVTRAGRIGAMADVVGTAAADRAEVATRAGLAAHTAGDVRRAMRHLQAALAGIAADADADRLASIYLPLVHASADAGDGEAAQAAIDSVLRLIDRCTPAVRVELLMGLVGPLVVFDVDRAYSLAQQAVAAADATGDAVTRMRAYSTAGRATAIRGKVDAGLGLLERARGVAAEVGHRRWLTGIEKDRATVLQIAARFEEALAGFEASQAAAREFGVQVAVRHNDAEVGQILYRLGRWREAELALERALQPPAAEWGRVLRSQLLVGLGRFDAARAELRRAWATVVSSGSSASIGPYNAALAEMAIWEGRLDDAHEAVTDGLRGLGGFDLRWVGDLSVLGLRAAADAGERRRDWAEQLHHDLIKASAKLLAEGSIYAREAKAALLTAEAESGRARGAADEGAWAVAAGAWGELHEPYPEAYALYRRAEALLAGPASRAAAADPLRRAWQLVSAMGAAPLLALVEDLARRARLPLGQGAPSATGTDAYALTAREREVLALLARGYSDRRIGDALFISAKTASVHVSNVKAKLGVEHRAEAAAVGLRLGLAEEG